jgi:hypothetical protein
MRKHVVNTLISACAVAREYVAGSAFLSVDSFGAGWVHAGEGACSRRTVRCRGTGWRPGRQAIALRHTLGARSAAWKLPEERRSA